MKKLFDLLGMTLGGWLGWLAGASLSVFTGFVVGILGTGAGLYFTRRFSRQYLP